MTTKNEIRTWLQEGQAQGATHIIVVRDMEEGVDYRVPVLPGMDLQRVLRAYTGNLQEILAVHDLSVVGDFSVGDET